LPRSHHRRVARRAAAIKNVVNILVTGGCGFVGSAICRGRIAHRSGCRITVLDNLRRQGGETNRGPLESLGVTVVHGDVRMQSDIDAFGPLDWLIDAAAEPSVLAGTSAGAATPAEDSPVNALPQPSPDG